MVFIIRSEYGLKCIEEELKRWTRLHYLHSVYYFCRQSVVVLKIFATYPPEVLPFDSGTKRKVKITLAKQTAANNQKAPSLFNTFGSVNFLKVSVTMKAHNQLTPVAIELLKLSAYPGVISAVSIQGMGPKPIENIMTKKTKENTGNQLREAVHTCDGAVEELPIYSTVETRVDAIVVVMVVLHTFCPHGHSLLAL